MRDEQQPVHHSRKKSSGTGLGALMVLFSLLFIVGPFVVPVKVSSVAQIILLAFGVVTLIIGSVVLIITRLYQKAGANEAFVRTGMGGRKAIIDGGAIVVPVVHELVRVSLETMKLEITRLGKDALLTADKLRADIRAEFFIRVEKTQEGVLQAATSLGDRCSEVTAVKQLVEAKLVSALRVVAATMSLEDLNKNRDKFAEEVQKIVQNDIKHNGYMLETVTSSHLDQAPPNALDPENNVFDAEGARRIAELVQGALTKRTEIERTQEVARTKLNAQADQENKQREVERDQFLFKQSVARTEAEQASELEKKRITAETARKATEVAATNTAQAQAIQAEKNREAQEAQITAAQAVELAGVAKTQAVQVAAAQQEQEVQTAQIARDKAVQTATVEREKAVQTATVAREQAVEVAKRERQIAVAAAEKRQAEAEAAQLTAQADREKADQAVLTVQKEAEAERQKKVTVIGKQATAESQKIEQNMQVDVEAYRVTKIAEAEQAAAEKNAAAVRIQAEAGKVAKTLEAEGHKAVELVPVQVEQERVKVQAAEVEVLKTKLIAQEANQASAIQLQVKLAEIEADKQVRIAAAEALGNAFSKANMTIWGDRSTVDQISRMFVHGQAFGQMVNGASQTIPADVQELVKDGVSGLANMVSGALKRLTGQEIPANLVEKHIRDEAAAAKSAGK